MGRILDSDNTYPILILLARMRVPKMVKNGFNSGLPVSPVFEEDKIPKEIKNRHEAQSRP